MFAASLMQVDKWDIQKLRDNRLLAPLVKAFRLEDFNEWPNCDNYNKWLDQAAPGQPVPRFVPHETLHDGLQYEERISRHRLVATRECQWHDFFNALSWALFPVTKNAIYDAHMSHPTPTGTNRSRYRDALTLFDECGVVIATTDTRFESDHRAHRWRDLFVRHRAEWGSSIAAVIAGHGLYAQCLTPYRGLTAKALYIKVDDDWFDSDFRQRCFRLDQALAKKLTVSTKTPAAFLPLPVLGVPGWHAANADPAYYEDHAYFRPQSPARFSADG